MVKKQKLLRKIVTGSRNIRFDEFTALLEVFGFILDRINGSHHIFKHAKIERSFPVQSVKGQAKPYQVQQLLTLIEQYQLRLLVDDEPDEAESDKE